MDDMRWSGPEFDSAVVVNMSYARCTQTSHVEDDGEVVRSMTEKKWSLGHLDKMLRLVTVGSPCRNDSGKNTVNPRKEYLYKRKTNSHSFPETLQRKVEKNDDEAACGAQSNSCGKEKLKGRKSFMIGTGLGYLAGPRHCHAVQYNNP